MIITKYSKVRSLELFFYHKECYEDIHEPRGERWFLILDFYYEGTDTCIISHKDK